MLPLIQEPWRVPFSHVWALSLCLAIATSAPLVEAEDKSATSGPALGTGVGVDNVFLGGHTTYYLQLPNPLWRAAGHVGVGAFPGGRQWVWGGTGGIMVGFGHHHRLVLDLLAGMLDVGTLQLHGVAAADKPITGVGLFVGWEWMTRSGFYLRATLGPTYVFLPPLDSSSPFFFSANLLSLGYKLW